jgi:hypothetical protein
MLSSFLDSARNGVSTIPAKMRFKTDFYKMRLKCGDQEVEPIQPGKLPIGVVWRVEAKNQWHCHLRR